MKRIISIIVATVLMLTLCSCGGGKPENTSDAMYQIGLNALNAADRYIAGEITGEEADSLLDEYYEQAKAQYNKDLEDCGADTLVGTEYENDSHIESYILILSLNVMDAKYGTGAMSEVRDARDDLAAKLGE